VTALALSADERSLISFGVDGRGIRWDLEHLRMEAVYEEPDGGPVCALVLLPNGDVLTGGYGGEVSRWSPQGKCIRKYICCRASGRPARLVDPDGFIRQVDAAVLGLAASADGSMFVAATPEGPKLFDLQTGQLVRIFPGYRGWVTAVCCGPDGELLYSAGADGLLLVHQMATGKRLRTFQLSYCQSDRVMGLVAGLSVGKDYLVSASTEGNCLGCLWHAPTGRFLDSYNGLGPVFVACFSRDGRRLIIPVYDGSLWIYRIGDCGGPAVIPGDSGPVYALASSRDGRYLFSGGYDHTVRIWDLQQQSLLACLGTRGGLMPCKDFQEGCFGLSHRAISLHHKMERSRRRIHL